MKRDYPDRPIVGVGAIVVEDGRAVVVRRASDPLKGHWSIPGGAVELGETLRQAAVREVREETGLVVETGEVLEVFDSITRDTQGRTQFHYVLVDFLCHPVAGELCPATDVSDARWVTLGELPALQLSQSAQRLLEKALAKEDRGEE